MDAHHSDDLYMKIFYYLLALTILEVLVALPEYSTFAKAIILIGMAVGKAVLVALYFMHLRFERLTLGVIAFTPMVICVFLVFMLTPDMGSADLGADMHKTQAAWMKKVPSAK